MAGANNYRRSLQNLFSKGGAQIPKTPPSLMSQNLSKNSWAQGGNGQDFSTSLMSYIKQENKEPRESHSARPRSSQDPAKPTWRYCELCDLHFQTQRDFQIHTSGTLHAEKALVSKTTSRVNNRSNGREMEQGGRYKSNPQQHNMNIVHCKLCNIKLNLGSVHSHMKGRRHAETYLSKITELGFRDFYDKFGDIEYSHESASDRVVKYPNGEYRIPKNAWNLLDVPGQFRKQVSEYIIRCGCLQNGKCKVCETDEMDSDTWWLHVCGKKHTANCAKLGLELGWNMYLKKYGAVPLLDHDAVDAIKKAKPYLSSSGFAQAKRTEEPSEGRASRGFDSRNMAIPDATEGRASRGFDRHNMGMLDATEGRASRGFDRRNMGIPDATQGRASRGFDSRNMAMPDATEGRASRGFDRRNMGMPDATEGRASRGFDRHNMPDESGYSHSHEQFGYGSNSYHHSSRPDSLDDRHPESHGTLDMRDDSLFERRQAEELDRLQLMGKLQLQQIEERERRERENRMRKKKKVPTATLR